MAYLYDIEYHGVPVDEYSDEPCLLDQPVIKIQKYLKKDFEMEWTGHHFVVRPKNKPIFYCKTGFPTKHEALASAIDDAKTDIREAKNKIKNLKKMQRKLGFR